MPANVVGKQDRAELALHPARELCRAKKHFIAVRPRYAVQLLFPQEGVDLAARTTVTIDDRHFAPLSAQRRDLLTIGVSSLSVVT